MGVCLARLMIGLILPWNSLLRNFNLFWLLDLTSCQKCLSLLKVWDHALGKLFLFALQSEVLVWISCLFGAQGKGITKWVVFIRICATSLLRHAYVTGWCNEMFLGTKFPSVWIVHAGWRLLPFWQDVSLRYAHYAAILEPGKFPSWQSWATNSSIGVRPNRPYFSMQRSG